MSDAPPASPAATPSRPAIFLMLPAVLAVLTHLPALATPFLWDDRQMLLQPRALHRPDFWREIFGLDYGLEFTTGKAGYYRPLFVLLAWVVHQLFGSSSVAYHALSLVAFTGLCVLAAKLFLRSFPASPKVALFLSCLFAVHPLNTDIVLFFTSLPDLVVAACAAGLLLLAQRDSQRGLFDAVVAGLLAATAALFKEGGFLLMAPMGGLLLLGKRLPAGGGVVAGLTVAMALRLQADLMAVSSSVLLAPFSPFGSGNALVALLLQAQHFLLPFARVGPRLPVLEGNLATSALVVLVLAVPAAGALWSLWKGRLAAALACAWVAVSLHALMLLPSLGFAYSERYASIIPLLWLLGGGLVALEGKWQPGAQALRRLTTVAAVLVALHGRASFASVWQALSARDYWLVVVQHEPNYVTAKLNLMQAYRMEGNLADAEAVLLAAIKAHPGDPLLNQSLYALAEIQFNQDKFDDALATLAQRDRVMPGEPETASLRAICLFSLGRRADAVTAIRAAMAGRPESMGFRFQFLKIAAAEPTVPLEELLAVRDQLAAAGIKPPDEVADEAALRKLRGS